MWSQIKWKTKGLHDVGEFLTQLKIMEITDYRLAEFRGFFNILFQILYVAKFIPRPRIRRLMEIKCILFFSLEIRVILQKINEMTLEICSLTVWTRIVKETSHVNMNGITLGKFENSIWAVVTEFAWTTHIIMSMVNFMWPIHININVALTFTKN